MALGRENVSVARANSGADVFRLAGFLGDDNLIRHEAPFGGLDSRARHYERIVNSIISQSEFWTGQSSVGSRRSGSHRLVGGASGLELSVILCSAFDAIERLVEHGLVPGAVPHLDIGLDLPDKVGLRLLLGGEALGTERAHLAVETLYVNRARLMIFNHDLPPMTTVEPRGSEVAARVPSPQRPELRPRPCCTDGACKRSDANFAWV